MVEILVSLVRLLSLGLIVVWVVFAEYLDMRGRMEIVEQNHPTLWRLMGSRTFRLGILLIVFVLLADDARENFKRTEETVDAQPPIMRLAAPLPPVIQSTPEFTEPEDSLRRRTTKLADELQEFWLKNPMPANIPNPQTPQGEDQIKQKKAFDDYWAKVGMTYQRRFKDRVIGIIREYKSKGIPTGWLEQSAENHMFGASPFNSSTVCFQDELCQFRELSFHVDAKDEIISPDF